MPPSVSDITRVAVRALARPTAERVVRFPWRVRMRYVDVNLHMNYASYLEVLELARWDWGLRVGWFRHLWRDRLRPVVGSLDIAYRRELRPLQRFEVETRATGFERRALVVQQRVLVGDREHTTSNLNILLLRRGGGVAERAEVERACAAFLAR